MQVMAGENVQLSHLLKWVGFCNTSTPAYSGRIAASHLGHCGCVFPQTRDYSDSLRGRLPFKSLAEVGKVLGGVGGARGISPTFLLTERFQSHPVPFLVPSPEVAGRN